MQVAAPDAVAPVVVVYVPAAHAEPLQLVCPVVSWYWPGPQSSQVTGTVAPVAALYLPAAHKLPLQLLCPVFPWYWPEGQLVHVTDVVWPTA